MIFNDDIKISQDKNNNNDNYINNNDERNNSQVGTMDISLGIKI